MSIILNIGSGLISHSFLGSLWNFRISQIRLISLTFLSSSKFKNASYYVKFDQNYQNIKRGGFFQHPLVDSRTVAHQKLKLWRIDNNYWPVIFLLGLYGLISSFFFYLLEWACGVPAVIVWAVEIEIPTKLLGTVCFDKSCINIWNLDFFETFRIWILDLFVFFLL